MLLSSFNLINCQVQVPTLDTASLFKKVESIYDKDGKIVETKPVAFIRCVFKNTQISDSDNYKILFSKISKWNVIPVSAKNGIYKISVEMVGDTRCHVSLYGTFDEKTEYSVSFEDSTIKVKNNKPIVVAVGKNFKTNKIEFGKGKSIDLSVSRLAEQKAFYSIEYDFKVNILSYNEKNLKILHNASLTMNSKGAIGTDDTVRNGTQTSIGIEIHPFYFIKSIGLAYESNVTAAYQIETKTNSRNGQVFDITNRSWTLGLRTEIPFSDYPLIWVHEHNFYRRASMPIIVDFHFLPKGTSGSGDSTLKRWDFRVAWELAISPFFIFQCEWSKSKLYDANKGDDNNPTYWSISFAQDLDAIKQAIGFLKFILGDGDQIKGKNFIFLKISDGSRAPSFQKRREIKFGFATYL